MVKMRILITGATGLIGREVASTAVDLGHDVCSGQHKTKPDFGKPIDLDINDTGSVENCFKRASADAIIHLAALTNVDQCETERELALQANAKAVETVAKEASKYDSHLVYMSTDYVFDGYRGMYSEGDKPNPLNWYGESKARGEEAVERYASSWCIARTSTPYGLHPHKKSFPVLVAEKLSSALEMQVLDDQYTSPTYVRNLAKMLIEIAEHKFQGIIHVSGSTRVSRLDFAKLLANRLDLNRDLLRPIRMQNIKWVAKRPRDSSLNVEKAISSLKAKPESTEQSLDSFCKELRIFMKSK
ncbi:MAG: dTDP-4-dehydrorhamnose reductase [Nitrososphaerales archaeon]